MDNSIMDKIIKAHFEQDEYYIWGIKGLEQWDQGQKLEISGLDISNEIVEVHFSLDQFQGNAERMYGTVKDGVIHTDIPVFILEGPEYLYNDTEVYNAYAWVYVSDEESAETIRKMEFEIKARPKPNGYARPDELSFLQQLENAIKNKITTPTSAKVGQLLRVKTVDENGKPTEFDTVDQTEGGEVDLSGYVKEEELLKPLIKSTTEKAPFHHITDSANMKVVDFGMEGKTEQATTPGNQLLPYPYTVPNSFYTDNGDGSVTVNGTPDTTQYFWLCGNITSDEGALCLPADTYTFSDAGCDDIINRYNLAKYNDDGSLTWIGSLGTYTFDEDVKLRYGIQITSGKTVNTTFYPMINVGSTALPFEPYTNGPSPNPDYPQEIVNAGVYNEETGRYEIGCVAGNGNLLPSDHNEWFLNHGSAWSTRPGTKPSIDRGYTYNSCIIIDVRPDTPVCFHNDTTDKYWVNRIIEIDNDGIGLSQIGLYGNESYNFKDYSFKTSSKTHKLIIDVRLIDKTQTFTEADLQEMKIIFGYGDSVTYTPHQSQPFTLTSPVPLTKWDYLTKRDGVYGWSIWSGRTDDLASLVNKTAGIYGSEGAKFLSGINMPNAYINYSLKNFYSEVGVQTSAGTVIYQPIVKSDDVMIRVTDDDTVETTKEHLHYKAYWLTSTEQSFHPLPEEEQELLKNLETYYGVTNLYNDQGCPMWLTYVADTKLYTDQQIAKQIAQTQALILEN